MSWGIEGNNDQSIPSGGNSIFKVPEIRDHGITKLIETIRYVWRGWKSMDYGVSLKSD